MNHKHGNEGEYQADPLDRVLEPLAQNKKRYCSTENGDHPFPERRHVQHVRMIETSDQEEQDGCIADDSQGQVVLGRVARLGEKLEVAIPEIGRAHV